MAVAIAAAAVAQSRLNKLPLLSLDGSLLATPMTATQIHGKQQKATTRLKGNERAVGTTAKRCNDRTLGVNEYALFWLVVALFNLNAEHRDALYSFYVHSAVLPLCTSVMYRRTTSLLAFFHSSLHRSIYIFTTAVAVATVDEVVRLQGDEDSES